MLSRAKNQQVHGIPVNRTTVIPFLVGETYSL